MPAWFEHLDESFPYEEFQFKKFWLSMKTSCPSAVNIDGMIP